MATIIIIRTLRALITSRNAKTYTGMTHNPCQNAIVTCRRWVKLSSDLARSHLQKYISYNGTNACVAIQRLP